GDITAVVARGVAIEAGGLGNDGPGSGVWVVPLPFLRRFYVCLRRWPVAPASQIVSIEQALESRLRSEVIGLRFKETKCGQDGPKGGGPFRVAGWVRVQEVGKFFRFRIALSIGEERPGLNQGNLCVTFYRRGVELIEFFDFVRGSLLRFRTGKNLTKNHWHF